MKRAICFLKDTPNWPEAGIPGLTGQEICIQLTKGYLAIIDVDDAEELSSTNWCATVKHCQVTASRRETHDRKSKIVYLHRLIKKPSAEQDVDHRDQHKFFCYKIVDNRRFNLRSVSRSQNNANQRKRTGCSSMYKGVTWSKRDEKWKAQITFNGRHACLGDFTSELEAALAYDSSHKIHFQGIQEGLNFPTS